MSPWLWCAWAAAVGVIAILLPAVHARPPTEDRRASYQYHERLFVRPLASGRHVHVRWQWKQRLLLDGSASASDLSSLMSPATVALLSAGTGRLLVEPNDPVGIVGFAVSASAGSWDVGELGPPEGASKAFGDAFPPAGLVVAIDYGGASDMNPSAPTTGNPAGNSHRAEDSAGQSTGATGGGSRQEPLQRGSATSSLDGVAEALRQLGHSEAAAAAGPVQHGKRVPRRRSQTQPHPSDQLLPLLRAAERSLPAAARSIASTFLGAAGAAALHTVLGNGEAEAIHAGAGTDCSTCHGGLLSAGSTGDAGLPGDACGSWECLAEPEHTSPLYGARWLPCPCDSCTGRCSEPAPSLLGGDDVDTPLPDSGDSPYWYGVTLSLLCGGHDTSCCGCGAAATEDSAASRQSPASPAVSARAGGLRVSMHVPPSSHTNTPLLSHPTLHRLLGSGAGVSRLLELLADVDADAKGTDGRAGAGGAAGAGAGGSNATRVARPAGDPPVSGGVGSGSAGLSAGHVPCAASPELPFGELPAEGGAEAKSLAAAAGALTPFSCPLNTLRMLGLHQHQPSSAVSEGSGRSAADAGAASLAAATPTSAGYVANAGWQREPAGTIGTGVGISSVLLPDVLAARSRWHAITVRARRTARNGNGSNTAQEASSVGASEASQADMGFESGGYDPLAAPAPQGAVDLVISLEAVLELPPALLAASGALASSLGAVHNATQPADAQPYDAVASAGGTLPVPLAAVLGLTHPDDVPLCGQLKGVARAAAGSTAAAEAPEGSRLLSTPEQLALRSCPLQHRDGADAAPELALWSGGRWHLLPLSAMHTVAVPVPVFPSGRAADGIAGSQASAAEAASTAADEASPPWLERRLSAPLGHGGGGGIGRGSVLELLHVPLETLHLPQQRVGGGPAAAAVAARQRQPSRAQHGAEGSQGEVYAATVVAEHVFPWWAQLTPSALPALLAGPISHRSVVCLPSISKPLPRAQVPHAEATIVGSGGRGSRDDVASFTDMDALPSASESAWQSPAVNGLPRAHRLCAGAAALVTVSHRYELAAPPLAPAGAEGGADTAASPTTLWRLMSALPVRGPPTVLRSLWDVHVRLCQQRGDPACAGAAQMPARQHSLASHGREDTGSTLLRFGRSLPLVSRTLMHGEEFPPDAHRGLEIPGATVEVTWGTTAGELDARPAPATAPSDSSASGRRAAQAEAATSSQPQRLHTSTSTFSYATPSLLWEPHAPDFSMPYNVMVLAGTAAAFVLGQLVNTLARARTRLRKPAVSVKAAAVAPAAGAVTGVAAMPASPAGAAVRANRAARAGGPAGAGMLLGAAQ